MTKKQKTSMLSKSIRDNEAPDDKLLREIDKARAGGTTVRLNVNVNPALYKQFKLKCVQNDETITDVIVHFMEEYS